MVCRDNPVMVSEGFVEENAPSDWVLGAKERFWRNIHMLHKSYVLAFDVNDVVKYIVPFTVEVLTMMNGVEANFLVT